MSSGRDLTRIVRSWMSEDEHESADRILDSVLDQLDTTPQRRAGWPAWRFPFMSTFAKFGLAAAAVLVAALLGYTYLGNGGLGGPGIGDPTPTPAATATPEPSVAPSQADTGALPEGPYILVGADAFGRSVTFDILAPDWHGATRVADPGVPSGFITKNENPNAPGGAAIIVFGSQLYVYGDPCEWEATRPETPVRTVDEVVAALQAQPGRDASVPVDVTVSGYAGQSMTLRVPDDVVFASCDRSEFRSWVEDPAADSARYHQDPGQIDELTILDVDGVLVVIDAAYYDGTPATVVDELRGMVESATFGE
jgi:hypothetical protein